MIIDLNAKSKCFRCKKEFERVYHPKNKDFSPKNNWDYWTENPDNKGKFVCNKCLIELYRKDKIVYLNSITNQSKRNLLRNYIKTGIVS